MLCIHCKEEIPSTRVEAIPETQTCVNCSDVKPYKVMISGSAKSKNYEVHVVKADDPSLDYHEENRWGKVSDSDD